MGYAIEFKGKAFVPGGRAPRLDNPAAMEAYNAALEGSELAEWAKQPERFAVYIIERKEGGMIATTWRGVQLSRGCIEFSTFRTNISRNMVAVRFQGTNGATYYGRYGADWSQLCRVRKAKGSATLPGGAR